MEIKYDYQSLKRFMEDLTFIMQTGGSSANPFQAGGAGGGGVASKIIDGIKLFFISVFLLVLLYMLYRVATGGYPRMLMNVATLSFYHKLDDSNILAENDFLFANFDTLVKYASDGCMHPYVVVKGIYNIDVMDSIASPSLHINDIFDRTYSTVTYAKYVSVKRGREKMLNCFREYFLFHNTLYKVNPQKKTKYYFSPKNDGKYIEFDVRFNEFYKMMIAYLQGIGAMDKKHPNKKGDISDNELMYDMMTNEKLAPRSLLSSRQEMFDAFRKLSGNVEVIVNKMKELPFHHFLLTPNSDLNINTTIADVVAFKDLISSQQIYSQKKFDDLNEYSWYMIEIFNWAFNRGSSQELYNSITDTFRRFSYNRQLALAYINLPNEGKKKAEIMSRMSQYSPELRENLKKYPIASRIFHSNVRSPERMYDGVMFLYTILMTSSCSYTNVAEIRPDNAEVLLKNLVKHANHYKQLISSFHVINLYLNVYRADFTRIYESRYLKNEQLFRELWNPHFEDIFYNRIRNYFQRITNKRYFNTDVKKRFIKLWNAIGKVLKAMSKAVWEVFKQKDTTKTPAPEKPDTNDPNAEDKASKQVSTPQASDPNV